jgi:hypothetical protein
VLVAGSGHSAFNALLDLAKLAEQEPETAITWVVRRGDTRQLYGGGAADQLEQRGRLGQRARCPAGAAGNRGLLVRSQRRRRVLHASCRNRCQRVLRASRGAAEQRRSAGASSASIRAEARQTKRAASKHAGSRRSMLHASRSS